MSNYNVYSFEGSTMTIRHPKVGQHVAYGTGLGNFRIAFSEDVGSHQISADLSIVISRHAVRHGTLTINVLQSTYFNEWLKKWSNAVITGDPNDFALTDIVIENSTTGDTYYLYGCTPQKIADQDFQPEAQMREWNIMAAEIVVS